MARNVILTTVFAFALSGLLLAQEQPQRKKDVAARWSFAYARTATQLVTLVRQDGLSLSHARELTWAVCPRNVTPVRFATDTPESGEYSYIATEGVLLGSHCLLIDSTSHDAMFYWLQGAEPETVKRSCVLGFPQAAEALTGRKVDSCYYIGGYGTGSVELIEFTHQSPKDMLAALLIDNARTPPDDPQYWIAKLPVGEMGWAISEGDFHPEQFQHLFTIIDDSPNEPSTNVLFIAIEWDGPEGAQLILYSPMGNQLIPVMVSHHLVTAQAMAHK